jgi:hypothetical protein
MVEDGDGILGAEGDVVLNSNLWARNRRLRSVEDKMSRLYAVEGVFSVTGTNAFTGSLPKPDTTQGTGTSQGTLDYASGTIISDTQQNQIGTFVITGLQETTAAS